MADVARRLACFFKVLGFFEEVLIVCCACELRDVFPAGLLNHRRVVREVAFLSKPAFVELDDESARDVFVVGCRLIWGCASLARPRGFFPRMGIWARAVEAWLAD